MRLGVVGRGWLKWEIGLSMAWSGLVWFSEVENSWDRLGDSDEEKVRKGWKRLGDERR